MESPSLEIFQPRLAAVLCSLLWVTLLQQGVGLGDPQRSLPTPAMLGSCDPWAQGASFWVNLRKPVCTGGGVFQLRLPGPEKQPFPRSSVLKCLIRV